jgi:hypothetical protein
MNPEGPMKTSKPDKTIAQLFTEFLADQKARLSPKTYDRYDGIIHLFRSYLESYWPGHDQKEYQAITKAKGTYCETFGAEDMTAGFSGFLDYFMPHKVIGSDDTMKAAGTVIKKLAKWLAEKGYADDDDTLTEEVRAAARDLPATQKLLNRLGDWLAENGPVDSKRKVEGHFLIQRIGPRELWLTPFMTGDPVIGPIPVPAKIARACKLDWDIGGVVALTAKGWRLVEVWNISP